MNILYLLSVIVSAPLAVTSLPLNFAFLLKLLLPSPCPLIPCYLPSLRLCLSHSELKGGSWEVTKVLKPDDLRRPDEELTEQVELSPRKGEDTHTLI